MRFGPLPTVWFQVIESLPLEAEAAESNVICPQAGAVTNKARIETARANRGAAVKMRNPVSLLIDLNAGYEHCTAAGKDCGDLAYGFGAIRIAVVHERSPLEATHDEVRFAVERRLVGLSTRSVSASVHYIRRERGRCLTRGRRFRAGVNKPRKTEPETQRTGAERAWNRGEIGGPTAVGSNGETNGDGEVLRKTTRTRGRVPSTNGHANQW